MNNVTVKFGRKTVKLSEAVVRQLPSVIIPELSDKECVESFSDFLEFGMDADSIAELMRKEHHYIDEWTDFAMACIKNGVSARKIWKLCYNLLCDDELRATSRKEIVDGLFDKGMNLDDILNVFGSSFATIYYKELLTHDVDVQKLAQKVCPDDKSLECLDTFIEAGVDVKRLFLHSVNNIDPSGDFIANCHMRFLEHGVGAADIFYAMVRAHYNRCAIYVKSSFFEDLFDNGLDESIIMTRIDEPCVAGCLIRERDLFMKRGMNIAWQYLVDRFLIDADAAAQNIDFLCGQGVKIDMDWLVSELEDSTLIEYFDVLEKYGAKIGFEETAKKLDVYDAEDLADVLHDHGYNFVRIDRHSSKIRLVKREAE